MNKNELIAEIKHAIHELTEDNTFKITQIDYEPERYIGIILTSDSTIKKIIIFESDTRDCYIGIANQIDSKHPEGKRFQLDAVLSFLNLEPLSENLDFLDWLYRSSKVIKQNLPLISEIFRKKGRFERIGKLREIERKQYEEKINEFPAKVRRAVDELIRDNTFRLALINFDQRYFGNIVICLVSNIGIVIQFIKDKSEFICSLGLLDKSIEFGSDTNDSKIFYQNYLDIPESLREFCSPRHDFSFEEVFAQIDVEIPHKTFNFFENVSIISRAIRQTLPLIIKAFNETNRHETIRRIKEKRKGRVKSFFSSHGQQIDESDFVRWTGFGNHQ